MTIQSTLNRHLQEKLANREWLDSCLNGETDKFPYQPDGEGDPVVSPPFFPAVPSIERVTPPNGPPLFLVNIPVKRLPSATRDYSGYFATVRKIRTESFGATSTESAQMVKSRVAVVLGINQIASIDPALNRAFRTFIQRLPTIQSIVSRAMGFFWKPKWTKSLFGLRQKWLYPIDKAFLLLKALSTERAEEVRQAHEQPAGLAPSIVSQVPYRRIREAIKESIPTRTFLQEMERDAPLSPIYFTIMDDDSSSFRPTPASEGIFSRLTALIQGNNYPSIASLGYSLSPNETALLRLAIKMDMAVRATMPMPYFPEPCTAFKVRKPGQNNFLGAISFLGPGRGRNLESRRFIENGGRLLTDGAVLRGDGGVVTATPSRMKTDYNQSFPALTLAAIKKKEFLQALRGSRLQTHAFTKQWADILYTGLPFSCSRVTNATTPMMHIFSVYDPISRMLKTTPYNDTVFDQTMQNYAAPLTNEQRAVLTAAKTRLLGLRMPSEMIDLVEETARRSGQAIYQVLHEASVPP